MKVNRLTCLVIVFSLLPSTGTLCQISGPEMGPDVDS